MGKRLEAILELSCISGWIPIHGEETDSAGEVLESEGVDPHTWGRDHVRQLPEGLEDGGSPYMGKRQDRHSRRGGGPGWIPIHGEETWRGNVSSSICSSDL